jgi:hypothetical protein
MEDWKSIIDRQTQIAHNEKLSQQQDLQRIMSELGVEQVVDYIVEQANLTSDNNGGNDELRSRLLSFLDKKNEAARFSKRKVSATAINVYGDTSLLFAIMVIEQPDKLLASYGINRNTKQLVFLRIYQPGQLVWRAKDVSTIKSIAETAEVIIDFILKPITSDDIVTTRQSR